MKKIFLVLSFYFVVFGFGRVMAESPTAAGFRATAQGREMSRYQKESKKEEREAAEFRSRCKVAAGASIEPQYYEYCERALSQRLVDQKVDATDIADVIRYELPTLRKFKNASATIQADLSARLEGYQSKCEMKNGARIDPGNYDYCENTFTEELTAKEINPVDFPKLIQQALPSLPVRNQASDDDRKNQETFNRVCVPLMTPGYNPSTTQYSVFEAAAICSNLNKKRRIRITSQQAVVMREIEKKEKDTPSDLEEKKEKVDEIEKKVEKLIDDTDKASNENVALAFVETRAELQLEIKDYQTKINSLNIAIEKTKKSEMTVAAKKNAISDLENQKQLVTIDLSKTQKEYEAFTRSAQRHAPSYVSSDSPITDYQGASSSTTISVDPETTDVLELSTQGKHESGPIETYSQKELDSLRRQIARKDVESEFNSLRVGNLSLQMRLNLLSEKYDNAVLGLYLKEKLGKLLSSNVLCESKKVCDKLQSDIPQLKDKIRTQVFQSLNK